MANHHLMFSSQDSLSGTEGSFLSGPGNPNLPHGRAGQTISHESNTTVVDHGSLLIVATEPSSNHIINAVPNQFRSKSYSGNHSYVPCATGYSSLHYLTYQRSLKTRFIHENNLNSQPGGHPACLIPPLVEIASKTAAKYLPFESVYFYPEPIPENLQQRIAYWAFPQDEDAVKLYSCLANGCEQQYEMGKNILNQLMGKPENIQNVIQIGFHLCAIVENCKVSVMFDRNKVTSCNCQCKTKLPGSQNTQNVQFNHSPTILQDPMSALNLDTSPTANPKSISSQSQWCRHVVALCLYRIRYPHLVELRPPVSESLAKLAKTDLQKFAQYLIDQMPLNILPVAQQILDKINSPQPNDLNQFNGAPDPTAGSTLYDKTPEWYLDQDSLKEKIKQDIRKLASGNHGVYGTVAPGDLLGDMMLSSGYSSGDHDALVKYNNLEKPLSMYIPDSIWKLTDIVRSLFLRQDGNGINLLQIVTELVLSNQVIVVWWFKTCLSANYRDYNILSGQDSQTELDLLDSRNGNNANGNSISSTNSSNNSRRNTRRSRGNNSQNTSNESSNLRSNVSKTSSNEENIMKCCTRLFSEIVDLWRVSLLNPEMQKTQRLSLVSKLSSWQTHVIELVRDETKVTHDSVLNIFSGFKPALSSAFIGRKLFEVKEKAVSRSTHELLSKMSKRKLFHRNADIETSSQSDSEPIEKFHDGRKMVKCSSSSRNASCDKSSVITIRANKIPFPITDNDSTSTEVESTQDIESESAHENDETSENVSIEKPETDVISEFVSTQLDDLQLEFSKIEGFYSHGHSKLQDLLNLADNLLARNTDNPFFTSVVNDYSNYNFVKRNGSSHTAKLNTEKTVFWFEASLKVLKWLRLEITRNDVLKTEICIKAIDLACHVFQQNRCPASNDFHEVVLFDTCQKASKIIFEVLHVTKQLPTDVYEYFLHKILEISQTLADQADIATALSDDEYEEVVLSPYLQPILLGQAIFQSILDSSSKGMSSVHHRIHSVCGMSMVNQNVENYGINSEHRDLAFQACCHILSMKETISEYYHPLMLEGMRRQRSELTSSMISEFKDEPGKLRIVLNSLFSSVIDMDGVLHGSKAFESKIIDNFDGKRNKHPKSETKLELNRTPADNDSSAPESPRPQRNANTQNLESETSPNPETQTQEIQTSQSRNSRNPVAESSENDDRTLGITASHRHSSFLPTRPSFLGRNSRSTRNVLVNPNPRTRINLRTNLPPHPVSSASEEAMLSDSANEKESVLSSMGNVNPGFINFNSQRSSPLSLNSSNRTPKISKFPVINETDLFGQTNNHHGGKPPKQPFDPALPSEALNNFYEGLAKKIWRKAGGINSDTYTQNNVSSQNKNLQLVAFEIGLYSIGIHNLVHANWATRTYSSQVNWLGSKAMDIGAEAFAILENSWHNNLTPSEISSLAEKASNCSDPEIVKVSAKLGLSCLECCNSLQKNEIINILRQCKKVDGDVKVESDGLLQSALILVGKVAKENGGVKADVLFEVMKEWIELHVLRNGAEDWDGFIEVQRQFNDREQFQATQNQIQNSQNAVQVQNEQSGQQNGQQNGQHSGQQMPQQNFNQEVFYQQNYQNNAPPVPPANATWAQGSEQFVDQGSNWNSSWNSNQQNPNQPNPNQQNFHNQQNFQNFQNQQNFQNYQNHQNPQNGQNNQNFQQNYYYQNQAYNNYQNNPQNYSLPNSGFYNNQIQTESTQQNPNPQSPNLQNSNLQHPNLQNPNLQNPNLQNPQSSSNPQNSPSPTETPITLETEPLDPMALIPPEINRLRSLELLEAHNAAKIALKLLREQMQDDKNQKYQNKNPPYRENVLTVLKLCQVLGGEYVRDFCAQVSIPVCSPSLLFEICRNMTNHIFRINQRAASLNFSQVMTLVWLKPVLKKCWANYGNVIQGKIFRLLGNTGNSGNWNSGTHNIRNNHNNNHQDKEQEFRELLITIEEAVSHFYPVAPDGPTEFENILKHHIFSKITPDHPMYNNLRSRVNKILRERSYY